MSAARFFALVAAASFANGQERASDGAVEIPRPKDLPVEFEWTHYHPDIQDIDFVDANYGWAVGGDVVLSTVDGGATWTPRTCALGTFLWQVDFVDREHGWLLRTPRRAPDVGGVARTSDGGRTWTPLKLPAGATPYEISFIDVKRGWVSGDGGVLATSDGGDTWKVQFASTEEANPYQVNFVDALHGWLAFNGRLLRTTDGGATWSEVPKTLPELGSYCFRDRQRGFGYFELDRKWIAMRTDDGGEQWAPAESSPLGERPVELVARDNALWMLMDRKGPIRRSTDDGDHWSEWRRPSPPANDGNLDALSVLSADQAWLGGDYGDLFHTSDGGKTWSPQNQVRQPEQFAATPGELIKAEPIDRKHALAFGKFASPYKLDLLLKVNGTTQVAAGTYLGAVDGDPAGAVLTSPDGWRTWSSVGLGDRKPTKLLCVGGERLLVYSEGFFDTFDDLHVGTVKNRAPWVRELTARNEGNAVKLRWSVADEDEATVHVSKVALEWTNHGTPDAAELDLAALRRVPDGGFELKLDPARYSIATAASPRVVIELTDASGLAYAHELPLTLR